MNWEGKKKKKGWDLSYRGLQTYVAHGINEYSLVIYKCVPKGTLFLLFDVSMNVIEKLIRTQLRLSVLLRKISHSYDDISQWGKKAL